MVVISESGRMVGDKSKGHVGDVMTVRSAQDKSGVKLEKMERGHVREWSNKVIIFRRLVKEDARQSVKETLRKAVRGTSYISPRCSLLCYIRPVVEQRERNGLDVVRTEMIKQVPFMSPDGCVLCVPEKDYYGRSLTAHSSH